MKSKNLLYIIIGIVLLVACVGLIYTSLDAGSNITENSSKINNTSSINNSNINVTDNNTNNTNNTNNSTNEKPIKNIKSPNSPAKKNLPKNIPKNSKLSYSKAYSIADSFKGSDSGPYMKTYVKYTGYDYYKGILYWKFDMYDKKTNDCLGSIRVSDDRGKIYLG